MDLFTHMLIGYLVGWTAAFTVTGYNEYLILIAVVMAMLPDFDFVLYVVPKRVRRRFRGIKHRGISHTILFLAGCSLAVAYIFNVVVRTDLLVGFSLAFLGGLSHVLLDGMTSFAFPYLGPFSWKERSLDLDGAVTWYMVPFSLLSIFTMWGMRAYGFPFDKYVLVVVFVFSVIGLHYLARLAVKIYVERVMYRGEWARINPTFTLLSFYVVRRKQLKGVNMLEYFHTSLLESKRKGSRRYFELDRLVPEAGSIAVPKNVYEAVLATSRALDPKSVGDQSSLAAAPLPSSEGEWKIFWFDWNNWNPVRGTPGTVVSITPGTGMSTASAVQRISW